MEKKLEKYVITRPSRFNEEVDLSIEKVHVGESVRDQLTEYTYTRTTYDNDGIPLEWWEKK